jgi:RNA polymerase sigma-70 factor (ECF subfamily)
MSLDFVTVYEGELDYVFSSLRRLGMPESALEDLAHDVFASALVRLPSYDPTRPLRPWLFGFAFRVASAYRNKASVQREVHTEPPETEDPRLELEEQTAQRQARALMLRLLDALDEDRRAIFILHEIEERSAPEIAEALEVPLNTVYSRLRSARQLFNAQLERVQKARIAP